MNRTHHGNGLGGLRANRMVDVCSPTVSYKKEIVNKPIECKTVTTRFCEDPCGPVAPPPAKSCGSTAAGGCFDWCGPWSCCAIIIWYVIIALITWFVLYAAKPKWVQKKDPQTGVATGEVDAGKALVSALLIALIIMVIIYLLKCICCCQSTC